ncbi:hypothetical protein JTB14_019963 [Gonioctena quinquepunctata]|nr:hypothetical protein JTB14_019963 [Gonioctena quinquepunctata]
MEERKMAFSEKIKQNTRETPELIKGNINPKDLEEAGPSNQTRGKNNKTQTQTIKSKIKNGQKSQGKNLKQIKKRHRHRGQMRAKRQHYMKVLKLPENETLKEKEVSLPTDSNTDQFTTTAKTNNQFEVLSTNKPEDDTDELERPQAGRPEKNKPTQHNASRPMLAIIIEGIKPIEKAP